MTNEQQASIARLAADFAAVLAHQREVDEAAMFADGVSLDSIAVLSQEQRVSHARAVPQATAKARAILKAHPGVSIGPLKVTPRAADDLD